MKIPLLDYRLAVVVIACGYALIVNAPMTSEVGQLSLVEALSHGTTKLVQPIETLDVAVRDGNFHSNKAPGLAFLTLPFYVLAQGADLDARDDRELVLWLLRLPGVVAPAAATLFLAGAAAARVAGRVATPVVVALGLGTLLFPYSTMFLSHVLAASLGFAAFAALFRRRGRSDVRHVALAGALAGLAVTVEYPLAIVAAAIFGYALVDGDRPRRAAAYVLGVSAGAAPLLAYQWWAYGSPFATTYAGSVLVGGQTGTDVVADAPSDLYLWPTLDSAVDVLIGKFGLFTTSPLVAAGVVGLVVLFRRGWRAEATLTAAILGLFVVQVLALREPVGMIPPGPRYFMPVIPFLSLPLAAAFLARPRVTAAIAAVSVGVIAAFTLTQPLLAWDGHVLDRLTSPRFEGYSRTAFEFVGVTGWYDVLPIFALLVVAALALLSATFAAYRGSGRETAARGARRIAR